MIIKDLQLTNFGKFNHKSMSLEPGLNIIYGENEAGKTTFHTFIRGMLFGIEKQRGKASSKDTYSKYEPWDNPSNYQGMMRIESNGVDYRIERNFNRQNKSFKVINEDLGRELTQDEIDKLFTGLDESCYYNTISISQLGSVTDKELENILKNYAANLGSTKSMEIDIKEAFTDLDAQKKKIATDNRIGEEYDVDLEFPKGTYDNASQLMDADIGGIPLSELATVEYTNAAQTIMKMDGKYTVTVTASCLSDDKSDIQDAMDQLLTTLDLPDSVSEAKTLMDTMQDDMFGDMGKALATAVFLVFLVMAMQFESPKYSLMVMLSIPFSLIGAFGLVFISGIDFSMVGLMGVLTLVGTVVNNGILYVDGVNMMRRRMDVEDALIEAGKTRLRPILITTLTTVISMTPSALGFGGRSSVMMQGMALVIIGGLVASTILILVLMPVFYLIVYGTSKKDRREKRQKYYFWKRKTNTEKPLEEV